LACALHESVAAAGNRPHMNQQRATDALANERTFLAYVRTALAFIAFGFVIARFSLFLREFGLVTHAPQAPSVSSTLFGMATALAGIATGAFGAYRYIVSAKAIRAGSSSALPDRAAVISAVVIGAIGLVVTWTLFVSRAW
jgi:putative membrane protein